MDKTITTLIKVIIRFVIFAIKDNSKEKEKKAIPTTRDGNSKVTMIDVIAYINFVTGARL